jgi:hypothetical protein
MSSTLEMPRGRNDGNAGEAAILEDPPPPVVDSFPLVAIRWIIKYNTISNVELATLSNVCRQWRRMVARCILEEYEEKEEDNNDTDMNTAEPHVDRPLPFQSLLLPSMIRELRSRRTSHINLSAMNVSQTLPCIDDTYCVAWFHPEGIEFMQLPFEGDSNSDAERSFSTGCYASMQVGDHQMEEDESYFPMSCEDNGKIGTPWSRSGSGRRSRSPPPIRGFQNRNAGSGKQSRNQPSHEKQLVSCVYQWNGYGQAVDILRPFGYSSLFIRRLLDAAIQLETKAKVEKTGDIIINPKNSLGTFSTSSSFSAMDRSGTLTFPPLRTFAVRGATYARPEGYCLCWDHDVIPNSVHLSQRNDDSKELVKQQEWDAIRRRRARRRRELQREVLPVVLWSRINRDSPGRGSNHHTSTGQHAFPTIGNLQPCVQFLNIDSSHAVRLFTPPFRKPISTPITVFCVAIATEDGCFFSGHHNNFEIGHMYPNNAKTSVTERSPIIICANYKGPFTNLFESVSESGTWTGQRQGNKDSREGENSFSSLPGHRTSGNGFFNSDDSSCDMSGLDVAGGNPGWKCHCPLTGLGDLGNDDQHGSSEDSDCDDGDGKGHVCRGRLGPGIWHCYTAIFDGENSRIRIDGLEEQLECGAPIPPTFRAYLDGLTIGSDSTFDMSLCFGQGSDGEGEGSMSELAVFKGTLDQADIETLETHLMQKHGIPVPPTQVHVEDEMVRLSHFYIAQATATDIPEKLEEVQRIPLRYLTRLRQVSWNPINPVTGEPMKVQRIGSSRAGAESSDW